ncbi:MAG: M48 family metallopeptidase [Candidatus Omnitrophota bacterium]|nr:M48 family metallopeptidase [Candidatus Omnitrophota bacterium]
MFKKIIAILCCIFLYGCATVYNPATQKHEFILIDTKSEVSLGKSLSQQIAKEFKISDDLQLSNRLKKIANKIAEVSDRQDLEYHFFVIDDKELNAFAIPGGNVYVNTGILNAANDDELAAVVAHEVGHIAARHSVKKLQAVLGYQIVMSIALRGASSLDIANAVDVVFELITLGYSREDERLADKLAIKYTYKSGFNPKGMVTFLYKLDAEAKKKGRGYHLVFLSSHPPLEERIKNMNKEIYDLEHPSKPSDEASLPKLELRPSNTQLASQHFNLNSSQNQSSKTRKICPTCKKVYSAKYNFCPIDGARLVY